jgi:hypothetical protein
MTLLFALLSAFIGAVLILGGYRLARFIIPLWGFVSGLSLGGAVYGDMANTPFLGTVLGVIIGLAVGLLFAFLAYFYYVFAVVLMAGGLGYWLGSSFILLFGFEPGFLSAMLGLVLGILAGSAALLLNAPKYVLIVLTSLAGAVTTVGGILLLFRVVPLETFSYAAVNAALSNSFIWTMVALALAIIGLVFQSQTARRYDIEEWSLSEHSGHMTPTHPGGVR